ncbi:MAG: peptidase domain-containing ABC transporter [Victivallales bacterium]|nr:peptidase domain-containing ABC transporter [Victivallales bacterium]
MSPAEEAARLRARHSGLFGLCAIARHHGLDLELKELMHEHAVDSDEPPLGELRRIIRKHDFQAKTRHLEWKELTGYARVFPALAEKKDGHFAILCGIRDSDGAAALVDPAWALEHPTEHFRFATAEEWQKEFTSNLLITKRLYALSDESQPFGLRWFLPYFLKNKGLFAQIALGVLLLALLSLATPLFFQNVVDKVLVNQSFSTLNVLGAGVLAAILFHALVEYLRGNLLLFATNKIDIATAMRTFAHLVHLPVSFFEQVPSGVILKHIQQTEKIRGFLSGNLFFTLLDLASLVFFLPFLLLYSTRLTLVVLAFTAAMALVVAMLVKPFQRRLDELYAAEGRRQSRLVEAIHGIRTVKSLALEPSEERNWGRRSAAAVNAHYSVGKISLVARTLSQCLEAAMNIAIIWLGALMVFRGDLTVGALIAFQMLAGRVTSPLVRLVALIHEYQQAALSVRMLGVVMNTPAEPNAGRLRVALNCSIAFEDVTFRYRPELPPALDRLSFTIPAGAVVGIVGHSGSGKTTLTKLLQGLHAPTAGLVKIDGVVMRDIEKSHLRSSIGVVLQENYFFNGTVRENICLARPAATAAEMLRASALAGAHDFVQKLPQGYDTVLEENASNLSGGQRQRLAIARALLNNPPLLIFDEATSALDPESEAAVLKNLAAIAKGRTVLIVSHRLSMVAGADRILVMEDGRLADSGTHRELLSREGVYRQFWMQQNRNS